MENNEFSKSMVSTVYLKLMLTCFWKFVVAKIPHLTNQLPLGLLLGCLYSFTVIFWVPIDFFSGQTGELNGYNGKYHLFHHLDLYQCY